jgi:hypothetical protein
LQERDYPALFRQANQASIAAQRRYVRLSKMTLVFLVTGAALASASPAFSSAASVFAICSAILVAGSLVLTSYAKLSKPEQVWYGGRAVAESAKSMTWRYVTCAAPYSSDLVPEEADRKFVLDLGSIFKERKHLAFDFGGGFSAEPQITDSMRLQRSAAVAERKDQYLAGRIANQRRWYCKQANSNRSAESMYFLLITVAQGLALLAAIALVRWPDSKVKLTGLLTSLASALIAWLQFRQHKELVQSYSIAELELGLIQEQARYVTSDRELSNFVIDAENAISREHTLWIARRDRT